MPEQVGVHPPSGCPCCPLSSGSLGAEALREPTLHARINVSVSMCSEHFTEIRFVLVIGGVPGPATCGLVGGGLLLVPWGLAQPQALSRVRGWGALWGGALASPIQVLAIKQCC